MTGVFTAEANSRLQTEYAAGAAPGPYISRSMHLATGDPGIGTPANEVSGGSYAAQPVTFGTAASRTIANNAAVTFSGMPAGTVTHGWIAGVLASTTQNPQISFPLSSSVTLLVGQSVTFSTGSLQVSHG